MFLWCEIACAQLTVKSNYYKNGNKESEGQVNEKAQRHGEWKFWNEKGKLQRIENYKDGLYHGEFVVWHNDTSYSKTFMHENEVDSSFSYVNEIILVKMYRNQKINSDSTIRFDEKGNIMFVHTRRTLQEGISTSILGCNYNNKLELKSCDTMWLDNIYGNTEINPVKKEDDLIPVVDVPAEFPGGVVAMNNFIYNNTRLPAPARAQKIYGKVSVSFIVEETGKISTIEIVKSLGYGCDEELMRVIASMPDWKPATAYGKPVSTRWVIPVVFGDPPVNKKKKREPFRNN